MFVLLFYLHFGWDDSLALYLLNNQCVHQLLLTLSVWRSGLGRLWADILMDSIFFWFFWKCYESLLGCKCPDLSWQLVNGIHRNCSYQNFLMLELLYAQQTFYIHFLTLSMCTPTTFYLKQTTFPAWRRQIFNKPSPKKPTGSIYGCVIVLSTFKAFWAFFQQAVSEFLIKLAKGGWGGSHVI